MKDRRNSDDSWRDLLTDGIAPGILGRRVKWMRRLYGKLPAEPRCKICNVPFSGRGGKFARVALRSKPSTFSMQLCARCEGFARAEKPGAGGLTSACSDRRSEVGPGKKMRSEL